MPRLAFFLATSGHSGVDRAMNHLIPALTRRGYAVDLVRVRRHGPWLEAHPEALHTFETKAVHVNSSVFFLRKYLQTRQPAVLYADKDKANRTAYLANLLAKSQAKVVLSLGTTVSLSLHQRSVFQRQLQKLSMKHIYPRAHAFIVPSTGVAEDAQRYVGKKLPNIHVVPRPVVSRSLFSIDWPPPRHPWLQEKEKPIILGVGELSSRKDFATLLKAFSIVRGHRSCRLMILGQGKEQFSLEALAQKLSLYEDVSLPGFVKDPYPYIANADVLVMSSRWEGLGFVLIEALALGTPVVSTDCPSGPREVLQDGTYGRLVPVGDSKLMAQAILDTLDSPLPGSFLQQAAWPYEIEHSTDAYLQAMGLPPRASCSV